MPKNTTSPTIYDVARHANVSAATVSFVLSGRGSGSTRISEETRVRVLNAVSELEYVPNQTARQLRRKTTERICLALPRLGSPFYDRLAESLQTEAQNKGYTLIISIAGSYEREQQLLTQLRSGLADGIVLLAAEDSDPLPQESLEAVAEAGIAVVVFSNYLTGKGFDIVQTTELHSSYEAVHFLMAKGHRRIALMSHNLASPFLRDQGYYRAMNEAGIPIESALLIEGASSRTNAYHNAYQLFKQPPRDIPTAIFAASDIGAISAIWAARDCGLRVPEDIAVIGVGNIAEGEISQPPLTSVGPTARDFTAVADLLFSRLGGKSPQDGRVLTEHWHIIERAST